MGRIYGFLGGVCLTSALVYQTGEYFVSNQRFVSRSLRASNRVIQKRILSDEDVVEEPPVDKSLNYTARVGVAETAKDIWNDEIIRMVNWLYAINWYQIGITIDEKINRWTDKVVESLNDK